MKILTTMTFMRFVLSSAAVVLLCLSAHAGAFAAGPVSRARLQAAAEAAGFHPGEVIADVPAAVRPRLPFPVFNYDDPDLIALRQKYELEKVVAPAKDEWTAQLLLREWLYKKIPGGNPRVDAVRAMAILDYASRGEKFYCTHYAISYVECAQALGWQARAFAVDRRHGPETLGSTHHGVSEVWSNQFRKWIIVDAQSDMHFEKNGVPLSAWEIRAEWLKNHGADVAHVVGVPPNASPKNPAIVWWNRKDEDETATYFWAYLAASADASMTKPGTHSIFPQDAANSGLIWYQNDYEAGRSRLNTGYLKNLFIPVHDITDVYWTVGIVEATITAASDRVIHLALDSYCPNRTGYEISIGGMKWEAVKDERSVSWPLRRGWNMLGLHTIGRRGVTGPETRLVLYLE
jgi:hypothetical protein